MNTPRVGDTVCRKSDETKTGKVTQWIGDRVMVRWTETESGCEHPSDLRITKWFKPDAETGLYPSTRN